MPGSLVRVALRVEHLLPWLSPYYVLLVIAGPHVTFGQVELQRVQAIAIATLIALLFNEQLRTLVLLLPQLLYLPLHFVQID